MASQHSLARRRFLDFSDDRGRIGGQRTPEIPMVFTFSRVAFQFAPARRIAHKLGALMFDNAG
jgi:hypothetical protein